MARTGIGRSVEGVHAVTAALDAGRVRRLWVERGRMESLAEVVTKARAMGASVEVVDDVRPRADTTAPQGVVADCRPLDTVSLERLAERERPALMVLDHVQDPQNLGAVARSAWAAGLTGLVMSADRAAPLSAAAFKAAVGAFEHLPVSIVRSIPDALRTLSGVGVWSVGLDAGSSTSLFGLALFTEPVAVVVGAEGRGLSRLVAERCDVIASIPMHAGAESLNASVAAALAAFEVRRVRAGYS